jgi:phage gp36-like protein
VIDTVVLGRALADADAEIDSYLAARYTLPLGSTPGVLTRLAADMTRYRLYDDGMPETVRQRYEDAVSLLKRMAKGEGLLVGMAEVAVAGVDTAYHSFAPRQMSDENLRGFA